MIRAQEVGQDTRVKRVTLGATLPKPISSSVERLGIHGIDGHAMVEQKIHDGAVGPLDRRPQFDALSAPLVQLPAPLAQAFRRVRDGAGRDLQAARIHNPDSVGLISPIHSEVIAHSFSSFGLRPERPWSRNGEVGLIPALSRGHFLLNLRRRSLADRDSLSVSLRGLCAARSSGQQARGGRAVPASLAFHPPRVLSWQTIFSW
jgi:hypothetical protein